MKAQNEIQKMQNDNILLHLGMWHKKNKKLNAHNKFLKRKIMGLKHKILMRKPRMTTAAKESRRSNLDVLAQVYEAVQ